MFKNGCQGARLQVFLETMMRRANPPAGPWTNGDDRILHVDIPEDSSNPIAVVYTVLDPEGSTFDLRKAVLFRDGHDFAKGDLKALAAALKEIRGAFAAPVAAEAT